MIDRDAVEERVQEMKLAVAESARDDIGRDIVHLVFLMQAAELSGITLTLSEMTIKIKEDPDFLAIMEEKLEEAYVRLAKAEIEMDVKNPDDQLVDGILGAIKGNPYKTVMRIQ